MSKKSNTPKATPVRNQALYMAMVEKRQGSTTAPHEDGRTKRARTRSASRKQAIKDSY